MDFDFEDTGDPLEGLWRLGQAFSDGEDFLEQLGRYGASGWPFGHETDAFLLWAEFGQKTTVN